MQRRLFFTSPVDHDNADEWSRLAPSLKTAVEASCGSDVSVVLGSEPVFGYGADVDEALAEIEELQLAPRTVRVDLWSSIVHYAVICVTIGSGIRRQERRALTRRLRKKELAREKLLREQEGYYDLDAGRVFGFRSVAPETLAEVLEPFDGPAYLGEEWLVHAEGGRVDDESFELVSRVGDGLALFLALDPDAEARLWKAAGSGKGLIAFYPEDPAEGKLVRRFAEFEDLEIFLAEAPDPAMRVTIDRCRQDDDLVVVYQPPWPPEIDAPLLFVI